MLTSIIVSQIFKRIGLWKYFIITIYFKEYQVSHFGIFKFCERFGYFSIKTTYCFIFEEFSSFSYSQMFVFITKKRKLIIVIQVK